MSFPCPACERSSKVVDSRGYAGKAIKRRRECEGGHRFNTIELEFDAVGKLQGNNRDEMIARIAEMVDGMQTLDRMVRNAL